MATIADTDSCPCGSARGYGSCCGAVHSAGAGIGNSAEQVMRARYSAYVLRNQAFLLESWASETRPPSIDFGDVEWHGLTVEDTDGGGVLDASGTVEFRARFRRGDAHLELHERSTFRREAGRWVYIDGVDPDI
ncbi:MAG: YchJ family protein [Acidimicrobiales bacterium]